jgi:pimeloyl-ACP methyl ester carboxylesterase
MIETRRITTAPGLTFDTSVAGEEKSPLVLMLHGFWVSRYFWNAQVLALGDAGFHAVAPNQRGYAAEARPDPADCSNYEVDKLIDDVMAIVDKGRKSASNVSSCRRRPWLFISSAVSH